MEASDHATCLGQLVSTAAHLAQRSGITSLTEIGSRAAAIRLKATLRAAGRYRAADRASGTDDDRVVRQGLQADLPGGVPAAAERPCLVAGVQGIQEDS